MSESTTPIPAADALDVFCTTCGYNLRGIDSQRCPECGKVFDRANLDASRIAWVHRRERGRIRAYAKTVFMGIVHPRQLAEEMQRPVSFTDAQRFRWVTVALAWGVPMLLLGAPVYVALLDVLPIRWSLMLGLTVPAALGLLALLIVVSGAHSYFFHPHTLPVTQQNRAVALSYYACAPLALMPLAAILWFIAYVQSEMRRDVPVGTVLIAVLCAVGVILLTWVDALRLLKQTTHCGMARQVTMGIMLPLFWLAGLLFAAFLPGLLLFIAIVVHSLR